MGSISAVSFVCNEEHCIEASLQALKPHVDEIVIVDLESTDRTVEIAARYTDKIFIKPYVICGDQYKMFLRENTKCDWLLWFYPDEIFPEKTAEALKTVIDTEQFTAFSFMRQEYMDGVQLCERPGVPHGTIGSPNYQNRLHKKCDEIFYTELVHAELHGKFHACPMPPELFIEHRKTSKAQELSNVRLYVWYKYLIWLYGDTNVEPYKEYIASYRKIVRDSEAKNDSGDRRIHPGEEEWWHWRDFPLVPDKDIVDRAITEAENV